MTEDRTPARWPRGQPAGAPDGHAHGPVGRASRPTSGGAPAPSGRALPPPSLTSQDMRRLTLYKWRYALESAGFTPEQANRLMFLRWLHARRR